VDVDCRIQGQIAQQHNGAVVRVGGSLWEESPTSTPGDNALRRYQLVGGRCCVYAAIPTVFTDADTSILLASIVVGDEGGWDTLLADAVKADAAAALRHVAFDGSTSLLVSYQPGASYQLVSSGADPNCQTVLLGVRAASDPQIDCNQPGGSTAAAAWAAVSDDEWLAFIRSAVHAA
jgi:hypothetical protein